MENPIKTGGLHTRMPADDGRVELYPLLRFVLSRYMGDDIRKET
jgi:hypothetical protein